MEPPHPGDRVLHPDYGLGIVLQSRAGRRVRVRFDQQRMLPRTVSLNELIAPDKAPAEQGAAAPAEGESVVRRKKKGVAKAAGAGQVRFASPRDRRLSRARLQQTIEALRLGVVPAEHVADYTVGRTGQIEEVRRLLTAGQGLRLIWGDYGAGKTHLLDVLEQLARVLGYVTARVVLDPFEVPPSHPQRLYTQIVRSLRYPGHASQGLEPLLQTLEGSSIHLGEDKRRYSRFLSPVLFAHRCSDPEMLTWALDYVEGQPVDLQHLSRALRAAGWRGTPLLALSDYRTYGRVFVHIVGTLATWARDAHFRGLLVLFDEVERLDALDARHRRFALEVLKHYVAATLAPKHLAFAEKDLYRGGHEVHRRLPLRYRANQPLVVLMTLTPLPETQEATQRILANHTHEMTLSPLGPRERGQLVDRVIELYQRAYADFRPGPYALEPIRRTLARRALEGNDQAREVVRGVVACLDALRYPMAPSSPTAGDFSGQREI